MDGEAPAVPASGTGGEGHYFMAAVRMDACIDQGIAGHAVDQRLILFARLIADLIAAS